MTQIIIPYRHSAFDGEELLYTLRSIEQNFADSKVTVIGDKPEWYKGDHIYENDLYDVKYLQHNILHKLSRGFDEIADKFVYWMDDTFIMKPMQQIPNYASTEWPNISLWRHYAKTIENTKKLLGPEARHYDVHTPMLLEKRKFHLVQDADWNVDNGYCIKSVYGNLNNLPATDYQDAKLRHQVAALPDAPFISVSDKAWPSVQVLLQEVFKKRSKYES